MPDAWWSCQRRILCLTRAQTPLFCELFPGLVVPASESESTLEAEAAATDEATQAARLGGMPMLLLGGAALAAAGLAYIAQL